jgi:hypothetical protein
MARYVPRHWRHAPAISGRCCYPDPLNLLAVRLLDMTFAGATGFMVNFWNLLYKIAQAFVVTPFAVAVHRFVLLGETTIGHHIVTGEPRYLRFFVFTIAIFALTAIPEFIIMPDAACDTTTAIVLGVVGLIQMIVIMIIMLRTLMLFPSIAVDTPAAGWRNAIRDTKGRSWRVFFILIYTMAPMMAYGLLQYWLIGGRLSFVERTPFSVVQSAVSGLTIAALAAMASHIYATCADRLGLPRNLLPDLAAPS